MGRVPSGRVPVVVMGLAQTGREICRAALASEEVELVGAVDSTPGLPGSSLGELLGLSCKLRISATLPEAAPRGAVVLHAAGARLEPLLAELLTVVQQGHPVVSTCAELSFPFLRHADLGERLDRAAQRAGVSLVATGLTSGFLFDRLAATAGQTLGVVRHVHGARSVDAGAQSEAFQRQVGAGLREEAFAELAEAESLGEVGLLEAAALCALGLGLDCDDFEEELVPLLAEEDSQGPGPRIPKGRVAGVHQTAVGLADGQERVRLELTLAVGAAPFDRLVLEADTRLTLEIPGGLPEASALAHLVVHAAPRLTASSPGLLTVLDLPAGR